MSEASLRRVVLLCMLALGMNLLAARDVTAQSASASPVPVDTFRAAKSWGYQLANLDVGALSKTPYDVLVIDYSRDGSEEQRLSPGDLERLKTKPDGARRIVLAYLSIGEAESYRYYWNSVWENFWFIPNFWSKPDWLGPQNGDWAGNYAVRYWMPAWQQIIVGDGGYLDRIVTAGFDGVWLDKVDSALESTAEGRPSAKADMITFIKRIAEKGRSQRPSFLVVPQNGEPLLRDPALGRIVDGFGKESLLVGEDGDGVANSEPFIAERTALLKTVTSEAKPVLTVEYIPDREAARKAETRLASLGFVPLIAARDLDTLPGAAPSATRKSRSRVPVTATRLPLWAVIGLVSVIVLISFTRRRSR